MSGKSSLFALGRLQYEIALTLPSQSSGIPNATPAPGETRLRPLAAYDCLDDAIRRLEEFVARYSKRGESSEACFLLAKALRDRATLPRDQLKRAETDNARKELTAKIQALLTEGKTSWKS